jgi:hypothetical protein
VRIAGSAMRMRLAPWRTQVIAQVTQVDATRHGKAQMEFRVWLRRTGAHGGAARAPGERCAARTVQGEAQGSLQGKRAWHPSRAGRLQRRREKRVGNRAGYLDSATRCKGAARHDARQSSALSSRTVRCSEAAVHLQMASTQRPGRDDSRKKDELRRSVCAKGRTRGRHPQNHRQSRRSRSPSIGSRSDHRQKLQG